MRLPFGQLQFKDAFIDQKALPPPHEERRKSPEWKSNVCHRLLTCLINSLVGHVNHISISY